MTLRSLGLLLLLSLLGCQHKLMPTPVMYEARDASVLDPLDPLDPLDMAEHSSDIRILYATDRNTETTDDPEKRYGSKRGGRLRLGVATVRLGVDATDWRTIRDTTFAGGQPVVNVTDVQEIGTLWTTIPDTDDDFLEAYGSTRQDDSIREPARRFADAINGQLANSRSQDVTIFVPGINTDFARPLKIVAGLAHYMGRDGAFIAYCWPASGKLSGYNLDTTSALESTRKLRELILFVSQHTTARRIHIIGYSRGAGIVTGALLDLRLMHATSDEATMRSTLKLGTVIYAGPDSDVAIFRNMIALDHVGDLLEMFMVYITENDTALGLSRSLMSGSARLGRMGAELSAADRQALDEVDALALIDVQVAQTHGPKGMWGHSYWFDNPWVASDVIMTLKHGLLPADRGLVRTAGVWEFPDDYPRRVGAIAESLSTTRTGE